MKLTIPQHIMFKLKAWRDLGNTEVTGFFITKADKPNEVIDAIIIEATCSAASVDITAEAIETMYLDSAKKEIYPSQLQIWWHTHPGNSASPSMTDETTFSDLGKDRSRNMMYILAKGGDEFAQISVTDLASGFMLQKKVEIEHPFTEWSEFPNYDALKKDYDKNVIKQTYSYPSVNGYNQYSYSPHGYNNWFNRRNGYGKGNQVKKNNTAPESTQSDNIIEQKLNKLTAIESEYVEELHAMVECSGLTADDADNLALKDGYGFNFYTDIYSKFSPEAKKLDKLDTEYILFDNLWSEAKDYEEFLTTISALIDSEKIDQEKVNLYFAQNNFDVCYLSGEYVEV